MMTLEQEIQQRIERERVRLQQAVAALEGLLDLATANPIPLMLEAEGRLVEGEDLIDQLELRLDEISNLLGIVPVLIHEKGRGATRAQLKYVLRNFPHEE